MGKKKPREPYRPVGDRLNRGLVSSVLAGGSAALEIDPEPPLAAAVHAEPPSREGREPVGRVRHARPRFDREKRVLLSRQEDLDLEQLVSRMAREAGTTLKASHILRACITLLHHADADVVKAIRRVQLRPRPSNGDAVAMAEFEDEVAEAIDRGLRDAPPFRGVGA